MTTSIRPLPRDQLLDVEMWSGWVIRLWRRQVRGRCLYDATLTAPGEPAPLCRLALWPTLANVWESLATVLAPRLRLPPREIQGALRSLFDAETHA